MTRIINRHKIDDDLASEIISNACNLNDQGNIAAYPALEELDGQFDFSDGYKKWKSKLIQEAKRQEDILTKKSKHKIQSRRIIPIAASIMIFVCLTVFGTFTSPPIKTMINNMLLSWNEVYVQISNDEYDSQQDIIVADISEWAVPDGFTKVLTYQTYNIVRVKYINDDKYIEFLKRPNKKDATMDSERLHHEIYLIGGVEVHQFSTEGIYEYIFSDDNYLYMIKTNIKENEIEKIIVSSIE